MASPNPNFSIPTTLRIVEVGPRDGLQNEKAVITPELKVELINRLNKAGLKDIEAGSYVSPKWVPQVRRKSPITLQARRSTFVHGGTRWRERMKSSPR